MGATAMINENYISAGHTYVFHAIAGRWRRLGRDAQRKSQRIFAGPFNLQHRLPVLRAECVFIRMVKRINRWRNLREPYGLPVPRIGVVWVPVLCSLDFFKDKHVAHFELQSTRISRATLVAL